MPTFSDSSNLLNISNNDFFIICPNHRWFVINYWNNLREMINYYSIYWQHFTIKQKIAYQQKILHLFSLFTLKVKLNALHLNFEINFAAKAKFKVHRKGSLSCFRWYSTHRYLLYWMNYSVK